MTLSCGYLRNQKWVKLAPMNPAAPVINTLRMGSLFLIKPWGWFACHLPSAAAKLIQHFAQSVAPMLLGTIQLQQRPGLVQYAVGGPPGRSREFFGRNRMQRDRPVQQTPLQGLFLNRDREIVPAGDTRIGPVQDSQRPVCGDNGIQTPCQGGGGA